LRSVAGPADHLLGLSLPVRAPCRRRGSALAAFGLLLGGGAAAPASRSAAQAAPVDQRSRGHGIRLVEPSAGFLPAMGGKGGRRRIARQLSFTTSGGTEKAGGESLRSFCFRVATTPIKFF